MPETDDPAQTHSIVRRTARVILIVIGAIVVVVIVVIALIAVGLKGQYEAPNLDGSDVAIKSLPCVTWERSSSASGGVDSGSPSANYQVGIRAACTTSQLKKIFTTVNRQTPSNVLIDGVTFYVGATKSESEDYEGTTPIPRSELDIDQRGGSPLTDAMFDHVVADWMTIRSRVDPDAQLTARLDISSEISESFTVKTSLNRVGTLTAVVPKSLQTAAWAITAPLNGAPVETENDTTAGRVTFVTQTGLPDAAQVGLGAGLYGAWPSNTNDEYVYVVRYSADAPDGIFAQVSNVNPLYTGDLDGGPEAGGVSDTTAWPSIKAMVDDLDTSGVAFRFGIDLRSGSFADDTNENATSGIYEKYEPSLYSNLCYPPKSSESRDDGGTEADLYGYWLSPTRPRSPSSVASKSCPSGLLPTPAVDGFTN